MIVISHSWEFSPKGSSHFNYHPNSIKCYSTANTTKNNFTNLHIDDNDSYSPYKPIQLDNTIFHEPPMQEKWHLKQLNDYTENEIYIKDGTVIISSGVDSESKIVKRCYSYDSPIIDSNWFNFKANLNDTDLIQDALCIFELQKLHVYFPDGSDFHINLSFKLKNCWKLKDGLLLERQPESENTYTNSLKSKQQSPVLYSLSHPLNEIKPVLVKPSLNEGSKITYWRENSKQVIVDVIENYDLVLVYNQFSNTHQLFRVNDVVYSEEPDVALSPTSNIVTQPQPQPQNQNLTTKTPIVRPTSANNLSMNLNQSSKRRLSVSPIVSAVNTTARFSLNTPAVATSMQTTATTISTSNATLHGHVLHHNPYTHHGNKNFSPMAALSRSPSCSSSPAILGMLGGAAAAAGVNSNRRTFVHVPAPSIHTNTSISMNTYMTPCPEQNNYLQCKTPMSNIAQTPSFANQINNRCSYTPHGIATDISSCIDSSSNDLPISEYVLEYLWNEQGNESSFNEKATKFFYAIDLYNQKYVCYLIPNKFQLRCLKVDFNSDRQIVPIGKLSILQAKDAVFVENRNLTIILDNTNNLVVYSGLTKLKLQEDINATSLTAKSPIISPIKTKLTNLIDESMVSYDDMIVEQNESTTTTATSITPKQNLNFSESFATKPNQNNNFLTQLPLMQNEYKSIFDSSGSRFTVKLNDNRLIRLKLNETTTCQLVDMCLEAFKSTLNKDIYYEIVQQWFIHRYTISDSLNDQLNLFLYLIISLCGCFDMHQLEIEMPFLFSFQTNAHHHHQHQSQQQYQQQQQTQQQSDQYNGNNTTLFDSVNTHNNTTDSSSSSTTTLNAKRAKCNNANGSDDDWEFLLNDQSLIEHYENSFSFLKYSKKLKRSNTIASIRNSNTCGILYPYLRNLLYTLHLIYEESKLYRSLNQYLKSLIKVLYLLANELNLNHYVSYYESECPSLLSFKQKLQYIPVVPNVPQTPQHPSGSGSTTNRQNTNLLTSFTLTTTTTTSNPQSSQTAPSTLRSKYSPSTQLSYNISQEPPSIHKFILRVSESLSVSTNDDTDDDTCHLTPQLTRTSIQNPFPFIVNVSKRTIHLIKIYLLLSIANSRQNFNRKFNFKDYLSQYLLKINVTGYSSSNGSASQTDSLNELELKTKFDFYKYVFMLCIDMNIKLIDDLYDYSHLISIPIFEAISYARENPILEWPAYVFDLIGRTDLAILKKYTNTDLNCNFTLNLKLNKRMASENDLILNINQNLRKEDEDGMQTINDLEAFKCRFNEDLRLKEVRSCLQTTRPIQIKLTQGPDVSDHDFVEEEEKFLFCICQRTMSLPIGRGLLTLHTVDPIPTEPVQIPELNLKGKSVTKKTTIDLTRIEVPTNMTNWPLFHNGVAAGLTIHAKAKDLSNAWIKSHLAKNFELTNEQAGFLYGLGLTGHLSSFSMLNVHDALARRHDLTNISILLGLAASKICSMDINVIRLISMHIRALMPPVEIELDIPYSIQIAALMSLGLVYAKSANKHISYVLLKEIGRLPGHEVDKDVHTFDREAYSLSAGLALGLVLLEKGKESLTIMDSMFTDELYHYMVGGHKEKYCDIMHGYGSSGSSSSSMAGITRLSNAANSDGNNYINYAKNFHNSHIREGETINTNVTSPAATIALGLIYFNSCDKSIAEWFSPPDSIFVLDSIRPDFLLIRTLARNLIMWKYILPTQKWILGQLPNLLKLSFKSDMNLKKKFSKLTIDSNANIKQQQQQKEKKFRLDGDIDNEDIDNYLLEEFNEEASGSDSNSNDMSTKIEAFRHIVAGACFSMALKFAGTCNNDAYHTLLYWARFFTDLNDPKLSTENCLCVCVLSLAIVMAGSGDLEVLRICRYLRSRVGGNINHVLYGSHMAINMAIGLLFMGGGRYTLKTDSLSVALMICAFYPHFPIDSNDNRFHLQAFRHLYVLASESRLLLTKDVDTNNFCYVPIEITLKANEHHDVYKYNQMAPCVLPELDKIKELKILGPRYYSIKFNQKSNFTDLTLILGSELFVKQRNGYFSYSDDPKDEKAFNIRNFLSKVIVPRQITPELLESITTEEHINLFAKMLNKSNNKEFDDKTNRLFKIIYESVIQETFDFVGVMLRLDKEVDEEPNSLFIQEMSILNHFYRLIPAKKNHIVSKEFLISILNKLENKIKLGVKDQINNIKSYLHNEYVHGIENLIFFCVLHDINKAELTYFANNGHSLEDLLKAQTNSIRIEKLLVLYQAV